jgi:hypothetical protein
MEEPMSRRHALLLALLVALAAAPSAHAKQIDALTVCGADGCRAAPRAIGQALHGLGGAALATTPRPAPRFRLVLRIGDGRRTLGTDRLIYVPRARAVGGDGGWSRLDRGTAAKLDRALVTRRPLAAAKLPDAALTERDTSLPPDLVLPPASTPSATSDADLAWWLGSAGALAAMLALALGLWRLRRARSPT